MDWSMYVKDLRAKLGWSQRDLADYLDMSKDSVRFWEYGKNTPSHTSASKLLELGAREGLNNESNKAARTTVTDLIVGGASLYLVYKVLKSMYRE